MTASQRELVLAERQRLRLPWHGPPHAITDIPRHRLITAACYEHHEYLATPERLQEFEQTLLKTCESQSCPVAAWCVLPNHYHALTFVDDMKGLSKAIGKLHGSTSRSWNAEDATPGRKVWHRCSDRFMRSDAHFFATLNYVHHNPVKHGYVTRWRDWPYSSVHHYAEEYGLTWLSDTWTRYPLNRYGKGWDE